MSYNLENNKSSTALLALLLPHLPNLARFSLHYNQKAIEHCSLKNGPLDRYRHPIQGCSLSRTCLGGRVAEFFPRPLPTPQVYGSVCSTALGLLRHSYTSGNKLPSV